MSTSRTKKQEEFLQSFNGLHKFLQDELVEEFLKSKRGRSKQSDHAITFSECIHTINERYKNTSLGQYVDQLHLINNFRNTIVHDYTEEFYDIADPSDHTMEIIQKVYNYFVKPTTIKKYINDKKYGEPITLSSETGLSEVLKFISRYKYSQFPVFDKDTLTGMITDNGITNFIANKNDEGGIMFEDETVADLIKDDVGFEEYKNSYSILYVEDELYRVIDDFANVEALNKYVLISKSGSKTFRTKKDLVGIFTSADITGMMYYLNSN
ncbi:CBS domain-containing protein [Salinicoccus sp. YB14-2]|uniref:CBS domain-containing protein n=1 Tax=Salinicoccus sp. YB14-2 TaxID=1572701 RepID=UPI00068976F5|nr:CBS domain-containing protein [Salinicoccus sp. YB14-2]